MGASDGDPGGTIVAYLPASHFETLGGDGVSHELEQTLPVRAVQKDARLARLRVGAYRNLGLRHILPMNAHSVVFTLRVSQGRTARQLSLQDSNA